MWFLWHERKSISPFVVRSPLHTIREGCVENRKGWFCVVIQLGFLWFVTLFRWSIFLRVTLDGLRALHIVTEWYLHRYNPTFHSRHWTLLAFSTIKSNTTGGWYFTTSSLEVHCLLTIILYLVCQQLVYTSYITTDIRRCLWSELTRYVRSAFKYYVEDCFDWCVFELMVVVVSGVNRLFNFDNVYKFYMMPQFKSVLRSMNWICCRSDSKPDYGLDVYNELSLQISRWQLLSLNPGTDVVSTSVYFLWQSSPNICFLFWRNWLILEKTHRPTAPLDRSEMTCSTGRQRLWDQKTLPILEVFSF